MSRWEAQRGRYRSRDRRYNRFQQRSRSDSDRARPEGPRDSSRIDNILQTILDRIDRLESRSRSRDGQPNTLRQPNRRNNRVRFNDNVSERSTRRFDSASTSARSARNDSTNYVRTDNPDFRRFVQESFRYAQLAHHQINWQSCPRSIAGNIDDVISNIGLPQASTSVQRQLQALADNLKSDIVRVARHHLQSSQAETLQRIRTLDTEDTDRARPIVEDQLNRRLGKRLHTAEVKKALDDVFNMSPSTGRRSASPMPTRRSPRRTTAVVTSPQLPRRPTATVIQQTSTTLPTDIFPTETVQKLRATLSTALQSSRNEPTSETFGPDPATIDIRTIDQEPMDTVQLSVSNSQTEQPLMKRGAVRIHFPQQRRRWRLTPVLGANTLIVADSNGASWDNEVLPPDMHVEAFKGAHLSDVTDLLNSASSQVFNIDHIVVAAGLNDRLNLQPDEILLDMQNICDLAAHRRTRLAFLEIPINPAFQPSVRETIQHLNLAAKDIFASEFIEIDHAHITYSDTDPTGVHYDMDSAAYLISKVVDHFLEL